MTQVHSILAAILHFIRNDKEFSNNLISEHLKNKVDRNAISTHLSKFYEAMLANDIEVERITDDHSRGLMKIYYAEEKLFKDHNPITLNKMITDYVKMTKKNKKSINVLPPHKTKEKTIVFEAKSLEATLSDNNTSATCTAKTIGGKLILSLTLVVKEKNGTINTFTTKKQKD